MNKKTVTREHRVLDETDLRDINNTHLLIREELKSNRIQMDSLKWVMGVGFTTISLLLATIGIGLALMKVYL